MCVHQKQSEGSLSTVSSLFHPVQLECEEKDDSQIIHVNLDHAYISQNLDRVAGSDYEIHIKNCAMNLPSCYRADITSTHDEQEQRYTALMMNFLPLIARKPGDE